MRHKAIWAKKGVKLKQTGTWEYIRGSDSFVIRLDSKDPVTGKHRVFTVVDDKPNFNGYVRILP